MGKDRGLTLALACPRSRLLYPNRIALGASLQGGDGTPVAGARIMFEAELDEGFEPVADAVTNEQGKCSVKLRIRRGRRYRARVASESGQPVAVSTPAAVDVIPRLEAEIRTPRVRAGSRAIVAGQIRPRKRYVKLEVEQQVDATQWMPISSREVWLVRGAFEASVELGPVGSYRCRVLFDGDAQNARATSPWLSFHVAG